MSLGVLGEILDYKVGEVARRCAAVPLAEQRAAAEQAPVPRGFAAALRREVAAGAPAVIAEIKKASPSKGLLREPFEPAEIARSYAQGGATCLSVLTDTQYFQGELEHLAAARAAAPMPALRKDFMVDAYQFYEARAAGADCVLLIVAGLDDARLLDFHQLAMELGLDVLVEVHDAHELERAMRLEPALLGFNNRDLRRFETRIDISLDLVQRVPQGPCLVSESGIHSAGQVATLRAAGIHAFLVGEAFMRADDPGARLAELFGSSG